MKTVGKLDLESGYVREDLHQIKFMLMASNQQNMNRKLAKVNLLKVS